ncbi:hypothetical protein EJF18_70190 [Clavispora lusitaniae]|uniref:Uncharacterized protein n=1 Tax=Clavispora lusitaniae TaxID=36911 RepID=A0ACD0WRT9_CLALS|nr:hypothetical protein EJF14_70190 [Clavispora lusitaniae]QFZ35784.1 hypothetical protein EJF16_70190 [Clavispora lusitaniae]QFZ41466.1 hypothetical protein EJF15_70190 [Clavispora lusitaniae]QFZ47144.1 hypothetical protein EJF18_70190 [Clavispora lusitaniae]QFZ52821.1 hypothetical protein EJF17_70190 [Clavispora lusitaniae]
MCQWSSSVTAALSCACTSTVSSVGVSSASEKSLGPQSWVGRVVNGRRASDPGVFVGVSRNVRDELSRGQGQEPLDADIRGLETVLRQVVVCDGVGDDRRKLSVHKLKHFLERLIFACQFGELQKRCGGGRFGFFVFRHFWRRRVVELLVEFFVELSFFVGHGGGGRKESRMSLRLKWSRVLSAGNNKRDLF